MKAKMIFTIVLAMVAELLSAQVTAERQAKLERRKSLTVKEWNVEGKRRWLDHLTVYDDEGYKLEEIEYAVYGQKERVTFKYDETGKCIQEVVYDDRNRVSRIRKYEYNSDGTKKKQYNYLPNGKLFSVKTYERIKN